MISYAGRVHAATNQNERQLAANQEGEGFTTAAEMLRRPGVGAGELIIGSTPTTDLALQEGITEVRPGTYIYGDANQVAGSQRLEDCAIAKVLATPLRIERVPMLALRHTRRTCASPALTATGIVLDRQDLKVARLSEEDAVLSAHSRTSLVIGDRVVVVPSHACTVVNLHLAVLAVWANSNKRCISVGARSWRPG